MKNVSLWPQMSYKLLHNLPKTLFAFYEISKTRSVFKKEIRRSFHSCCLCKLTLVLKPLFCDVSPQFCSSLCTKILDKLEWETSLHCLFSVLDVAKLDSPSSRIFLLQVGCALLAFCRCEWGHANVIPPVRTVMDSYDSFEKNLHGMLSASIKEYSNTDDRF